MVGDGVTRSNGELPFGVYERLIDGDLNALLNRVHGTPKTSEIDEAELANVLTHHLHERIREAMLSIKPQQQLAFANDILERLSAQTTRQNFRLQAVEAKSKPPLPQQLDSLVSSVVDEGPRPDLKGQLPRTTGRFGDPDLLVNAPNEPNLASQLIAEMKTADQVDLLASFIRWTGVRLLDEGLRDLRDRGVPFRVLTTTYIGATERKALDRLSQYGAEIRVNFDSSSTRLHAKAWSFKRNTGLNTAYIGSSNLSQVAMDSGVEWNVKVSSGWAPHIIEKFDHSFEAYWLEGKYEAYDSNDEKLQLRLDEALRRARAGGKGQSSEVDGGSAKATDNIAFLDVRLYPFQEEMLEDLAAQRAQGHHRNLIVAATGTGKTVMAAVDYARMAGAGGLRTLHKMPRLLFLAHRKEILTQARGTYRHALKDQSFGELFVDGHRPQKNQHIFASVQSMFNDLDRWPSDYFDIIVVDEFHHAEAATFRKILEHFQPRELLGMTATPERADGTNVAVSYFNGRIASELRLWDALDADLLVPFHYFGVADGTDLSGVKFIAGAYDVASLQSLYVGNDQRSQLILSELYDKIVNPHEMKALGFCVSIKHAEYMADVFNEAGIPALAISSKNDPSSRAAGLDKLRNGEVAIVFAVDIFNEGVDIPHIDTVLMLRPTQSATVFLQQLGRGLRKAHGKTLLTVLDFVGNQHAKFRFDMKLRAMSGLGRKKLLHGVEHGFDQLPPGVHIVLDESTQKEVMRSLKASINLNAKQLMQDIRDHGGTSIPDLSTYLRDADRSLEDIYRIDNFMHDGRKQKATWLTLKNAATGTDLDRGIVEADLLSRIRAFRHVDDPMRIEGYRRVLAGNDYGCYAKMLFFSLYPTGKLADLPKALAKLRASRLMRSELEQLLDYQSQNIRFVPQALEGNLESRPIFSHARYTREELLIGLGLNEDSAPGNMREGVKWIPETQTDVLLVTLNKSDADYSPTTMYRDFALNAHQFHWESQSTTSIASPTGRRYVTQKGSGRNVVLFVRESKKDDVGTAPYTCLGQVDYERHEGSLPIQIVWHLRRPMPAQFYLRSKLAG